MQKINDLLGKYKKLAIPNEDLRKKISDIIFEELKLEIDFKNVSIKNSIAYIKCESIERSEIFLKKKKILNKIADSRLTPKIADIR